MRASEKLSSGSAAREARRALPRALPDDDATAVGAAALRVAAPTRYDDAQRVEAVNGLDPLSILQHRAQARSEFVAAKRTTSPACGA